MLSIARNHKMLFLALGIVVIYALQFLMFPKCLPQYYPVSNEASSILIVPLVVFSILMNFLIDVNIGRWAILDILYGTLMAIYNGRGYFGIGRRGLAIDGVSSFYSLELSVITIIVIVLVLFVFQTLVRVIRLAFLKAKNNTK